MKYLFSLIILLAVIAPAFAQSNSQDESSFYYVNVLVEKIYPTNKGYIVLYRTQSGVATIGIPNSWFTEAAGKADYVTLPRGANWPTMSVFYQNGEFSHLRIYVHPHKGHLSWGNLPQGSNVERYFPDGDSLKLEF